MIVIKKKSERLNEDDIQNGKAENNTSSDVQSQSVNQKAIAINNQIVGLLKQKVDKKTEYQNNIRNIENQILQLEKQKADLGEDVETNIIESVKLSYSFWKRLYESTDGRNRTDEMYMIISMSFSQIENLSYQPTTTWCMTFAKKVVEYLNKDYKDAASFIDFIEKYINSSQISLAMREKSAFISNFESNIRNSRMFGYTLEEK